MQGVPKGLMNGFFMRDGKFYSLFFTMTVTIALQSAIVFSVNIADAVMLSRYAGGTAASADLSAFSDAGSISDWAQEAMNWAVANQILSGDDTGRLNPGGSATRAEVAQILFNYCTKVLDA